MIKLKLPYAIQNSVMNYLNETERVLYGQEELHAFINLLSPSLKESVFFCIFSRLLDKNPNFLSERPIMIFIGNFDFCNILNIAKRLSIHMYDPEHKIIKQNDKAGHMYFISSGECTVIVKDQNFKKQNVRILKEGDYFGEVALMTRAKRTATVTANNY